VIAREFRVAETRLATAYDIHFAKLAMPAHKSASQGFIDGDVPSMSERLRALSENTDKLWADTNTWVNTARKVGTRDAGFQLRSTLLTLEKSVRALGEATAAASWEKALTGSDHALFETRAATQKVIREAHRIAHTTKEVAWLIGNSTDGVAFAEDLSHLKQLAEMNGADAGMLPPVAKAELPSEWVFPSGK